MSVASRVAPLSFADIEEVGRGLVARTFPADRFHHREHLLATAYLMRCMPELDLRQRLPEIIRQYNVAMGGKNTDDAGYHHTITLFHIEAIEQFFGQCPDEDLAASCEALLDSSLNNKDFPLAFYTRDLLFSREARREWVAPDLRSLSEIRQMIVQKVDKFVEHGDSSAWRVPFGTKDGLLS